MPTPPAALCADPLAHVAGIVEAWKVAARSAEPWLSLPEAHRIDGLPDVAAAVVDAAICRPTDPAAAAGNVRASAAHGEARAGQGCATETVLTDYYLLRQAVWAYLLQHGQLEVASTILRVDVALTMSHRAGLLGFHRAALEAQGRWPAALDELSAEEAERLAAPSTPARLTPAD